VKPSAFQEITVFPRRVSEMLAGDKNRPRAVCWLRMRGRLAGQLGRAALRDSVVFLDSYASLLVLLLANFFLLELIDDPRWGALGSTLLSAAALVVAISDPAAERTITSKQALIIGACVALAPLVLVVNSASIIGLTYLLPVVLLVTATLPVTISRVVRHPRVTHETVLGALCAYVLIGLLFAFVYLAVNDFRTDPFFAQPGEHTQSEYLYFSFVTLTTLGFGDLSPSVGLPQALTALEALLGQVFLVTMVARLVTLWVRQSGNNK
jgi:ion channel